MNVLVIGANGQIGKHLIQKIEQHTSHKARAMVRRREQKETFEELGVESVIGDLEGSIDDLVEVVQGCDAVVFTAGSGGHTGADKTVMIDLDGAIKSMEAAKKANVKRFVIVSAIGVHRRENWMESAPYYSAAKHYADGWLVDSGLDYTIIRPGGLTNDEGTRKVKVAEDLDRGKIPREDVANVILAVLEDDTTVGKSFDLTSGEHAVEEAIRLI
ncbi:SDR family oxidoreductase [Shouchella patagoniensis]|uniref:SDR family oxidoreductase n=1 Tax=Shouchella patagoniensis TaxID=228576 RepID=UPI0009953E69|nr:SDR family oxidoreductase [Shouchella patagoniensis]